MLVGKEVAEDHDANVEGKMQEPEILLRGHSSEYGIARRDSSKKGTVDSQYEGRRKKEEGRRKKEEGRGKREEGICRKLID